MLAEVWKDLKVEAMSARDVARLAAAWAKLANSAQEPSSLQLPEMQLPLLAQNTEAKLLTVSKCDELLLALPVQSSRNFDRSTTSDFDCNSLPLVASSHPQEAVLAMVQYLKRPLLLKDLPLESRFFGQLQMTGAHVRFTQQWQRAALLVNGSFEEWLARNFDHKRRKEFKRLRKRLSEQGELKLESSNPNSDFDIKMLEEDLEYLLKKLDITAQDFEDIMNAPAKSILDYPNYHNLEMKFRRALNKLRAMKLLPN